MALPELGAHLIVFGPRYTMENDADLILDGVVEAGYTAVEGGGPPDAAAYKEMLDKRGLTCAGLHTALSGKPDVEELIAKMKTLECRHLCNSGILTWQDRTPDDWKESIGLLNDMGKRLREEGMFLHYHNHDFEFEKADGDKTGMDLLLAGLDFDSIDLCVDLGWVHVGGADPAAFLQQHGQRTGYIHLKDYERASGVEGRQGLIWRELGNGVVDWQPVFAEIEKLDHIEWALVEQDRTDREPKESLAISRRYLKQQFDY